ncbi:21340_t:CDS:2, partial [Racocetra persica]
MNELEDLFHDEQYIFASILIPVPPYEPILILNSMTKLNYENPICDDQDISASTSTQAPFPEVMIDSNLFDNESDRSDDPSDSNRFNYKVKTSEITNGVMKKATYECIKSSLHAPQVTSDPTKRHNIYSQRIQCQWK